MEYLSCGFTILPRNLTTQHHNKNMAVRSTYCFTYNNYTDETVGKLRAWIEENCKYGCFQKEVAPTTGTRHLQGYINLKKQARMTTIQKKLVVLGIQLALINANGTPAQNRAYCSKEGGEEFWETGNINIVGQGVRTDLKDACGKIKNKRPLSEVASDHPEVYVKYHRGLSALVNILDDSPKEREMDVVVLYGDAGTGKSTKARSYAKLYGEYYTLGVPSGGALWFDGYNGEDTIIIDEFKGWIQPTYLNQLLDSYKMMLPIKGGFVPAKYKHVFITSNYPPEDWWSEKVHWNKEALYRRIHHVYEFTGNNHVDCIVKKLK